MLLLILQILTMLVCVFGSFLIIYKFIKYVKEYLKDTDFTEDKTTKLFHKIFLF